MANTAFAVAIDAQEEARQPVAQISSEHVRLIRESYMLFEPASDLVATLFFQRLLEIAPEVQPMLHGDMDEQRQQLLIALGLAVASLERFDDIIPSLKLLGAKYRAMGVEPYHYGGIGEALLWTLNQSLGSNWSPELEDAWSALCTVVAEAMTEAG
jgi:hemoglobin-like flavoprotein